MKKVIPNVILSLALSLTLVVSSAAQGKDRRQDPPKQKEPAGRLKETEKNKDKGRSPDDNKRDENKKDNKKKPD